MINENAFKWYTSKFNDYVIFMYSKCWLFCNLKIEAINCIFGCSSAKYVIMCEQCVLWYKVYYCTYTNIKYQNKINSWMAWILKRNH